ncbi:MAG: OmpA family protein [Bacteroidales bacterium]|nr:OmpA family protein [Bacteroidales bacterium]
MKRIITLALLLFIMGSATEAYSQSWLNKLGKKVEEKAKRKVEEKTEKAVDKAFDKAEDAVTGKGKDQKGETANTAGTADADGQVAEAGGQQQKKSAQMSWNKFDFVAGDEIIFEDNVTNEQMGEFPSQWDLIKGNAEIVEVDGMKAIQLDLNTEICPLMKDMSSYLPEKFTIEFDYYGGEKYDDVNGPAKLILKDENNSDIFTTCIQRNVSTHNFDIRFRTPNNEERRSNPVDGLVNLGGPGWHHFSLSFNKRALKCYTNETRICALPNVKQPVKLVVQCTFRYKALYIRNIRIAQGAVPLYDRMMSDGKFITYGITFDVGKSVIKPESMGEINRIVQLMTENPDLKFSVEGHTDATGNAASNQTLSEQRSAAIVAKLVELGITQDRLTSVGKGQNSPIADNSTDEGRAKNRRVEFVKQ